MGPKNHEEDIREAYVHSLVKSGISEYEAQETANSTTYLNQFKRAEIIAYREDTGQQGSVPVRELAKYVDNKYSPGNTVSGQGEGEQDEVPTYTLEDFKLEVLACENQYHLTNWAKKHAKRIKRHLTCDSEVAELRSLVSDRLAELRGDPPAHEAPPPDMDKQSAEEPREDEQVVEEEPEKWQLAVEFNALCTEDQVKQLAGAVSNVLKGSPFVVAGSCKMVTR